MADRNLSLKNVAGGRAPAVFAREVKRILENIEDPNTDPQQKRKITLVFEFKPLETRKGADVLLKSKCELASIMPLAGHVNIGRIRGELVAVPSQTELFDSELTEETNE